MRGAQRLAFVLVAMLAVCAAGIGVCQQAAPAQERLATERDNDLKELQQTGAEQQREIDGLAGRVDGMSGSMDAAAKASEAASRHADLVIKLVGVIFGLATVAGYLGYRDLRRIRASARAAEREAREHLGKVEECEKQVSTALESTKGTAQKAQEYVSRIESFAAQAEGKARELQSVRIGTELPPETKQALEDVNRRLELVEALGLPLDVEAWLARAGALYEKGDYQRALDCCDRAIELKPADPHAHDGRGCTLAKLGRWEEALTAETRAIELEADYPSAYYNRAFVRSALGNRNDALADVRKAIELDAEFREMAKTDEDFAGLRDDPEFRRLVGLDEEGEGAGDG